MNLGQDPCREFHSESEDDVDHNVGSMSAWSSDASMDPEDEDFLLRSASYQATSDNDVHEVELGFEYNEVLLVEEYIVPVQRIRPPSTHNPQRNYGELTGQTSHQPDAMLSPQSFAARCIPQDGQQHPPWSSNMPDDVNHGSLELYSPLRGHLPQEIIGNPWTKPEPVNEGTSASGIIPDLVTDPCGPAGDHAAYPSELESLSGSPVSATDDSWIGTGNTRPVISLQPRHDRSNRCSSCQQSFADARGLRRHTMSAHSGRRPYSCLIPGCSYSRHGVHRGFTRRDSLRRHVRSKHLDWVDAAFRTPDTGG